VPWDTLSLAEATFAVARGDVGFPLVIKARFGFGSLDQAICREMHELEWLYRRAVADQRESDIGHFIDTPPEECVLVQAFVDGPEWCLVLVNDPNGRHAGHFVTEVHQMRAGESDRATTLAPEILGDFPERLAALTGYTGIWGVDLRMGDGRPAIIDLNPRFTGDYPFQQLAGANVPAALVAWALGEEPDPAWLRSEAGVTGYKDLMPMREWSAG
jgi:carbamoyl-phosphate synthase large subunit